MRTSMTAAQAARMCLPTQGEKSGKQNNPMQWTRDEARRSGKSCGREPLIGAVLLGTGDRNDFM